MNPVSNRYVYPACPPSADHPSSLIQITKSSERPRIVQKQSAVNWSDGFLTQLSADLMTEFPDMKGFSVRTLKYVRQWYLFYSSDSQTGSPAIGQQLVAQLARDDAGAIDGEDEVDLICLCEELK